jgi:hypothetical protein
MIFVLADDLMLTVLDSEKESQGGFEGVDVEDNLYKFFDEKGKPLVPEFIKANKRGKFLLLIRWVESGKYRLIPAKLGTLPHLLDIWDSIAGLDRNSHFSSLVEVRQYLER